MKLQDELFLLKVELSLVPKFFQVLRAVYSPDRCTKKSSEFKLCEQKKGTNICDKVC